MDNIQPRSKGMFLSYEMRMNCILESKGMPWDRGWRKFSVRHFSVQNLHIKSTRIPTHVIAVRRILKIQYHNQSIYLMLVMVCLTLLKKHTYLKDALYCSRPVSGVFAGSLCPLGKTVFQRFQIRLGGSKVNYSILC